MGRFVVAGAALALLAGCHAQPVARLEVRDAWVRLAAVPGRPAAAYFNLAGAATADRLVAVTSPKVATIELHGGGMSDGMMTMRKLDGVDVPVGGSVAFAPGGNHAMLFGVDPSVKPNATLPLSFRFASGARMDVAAATVNAGGDAPDHGAH